MKKTLALFLFLFALFAIAGKGSAAPLFWSANGTTLGGAGTWDTTTPNRWGAASTGPFDQTWNNANGDTAVFAGTTGAVTIGASVSVTAGGMIFTNSSTAAFSIAPGTSLGIVLTGNPTIFLDGNTSNRPSAYVLDSTLSRGVFGFSLRAVASVFLIL
jgi:hypothetical protein